MSPRTGRPPLENPKSDRITIRLTEYEQKVLSECRNQFGTSNAEIMRMGLSIMEVAKDSPEARQLFDAIVLLNEFISNGRKDLVQKQIDQVKNNFVWYLESLEKQ